MTNIKRSQKKNMKTLTMIFLRKKTLILGRGATRKHENTDDNLDESEILIAFSS